MLKLYKNNSKNQTTAAIFVVESFLCFLGNTQKTILLYHMNIKNTINNLNNAKYFTIMQYGVLTGLLQSAHDNQIFDKNYNSKILQYIRHQSLSRDLYYTVYKEVNAKGFLHSNQAPWKNVIYNVLGNTLGVFIGAFGYNSLNKNILLLSAMGGVITLQMQKFFGKDANFIDLIFGMMSTIEGINIEQNISTKFFMDKLSDCDFDGIYDPVDS